MAGGLALAAGAFLIPAHLRAVNPLVLERAGGGGEALVKVVSDTAAAEPAVSKLLLRAAEDLRLTGTEEALEILRDTASVPRPPANFLQQLEREVAGRAPVPEVPVVRALEHRSARSRFIPALASAPAQAILRNRALTNLLVFPPVQSAAGAPLEIAILTAAFLADQGSLRAGQGGGVRLEDAILGLCAAADRGQRLIELEEFYLNMLALAKRFSSGQLQALVACLPNLEALDALARVMQNHPGSEPELFAAVILHRDGSAVARHLLEFPESALGDLNSALALGSRSLGYLLASESPVYRADLHNSILGSTRLGAVMQPLARFAADSPRLALVLKLALILAGGFLLAFSARYWKDPASDFRYVAIPRFTFARRCAFALLFLMLVVILGEPYLAQGESAPPPEPLWTPVFANTADSAASNPQPPSPSQPMLDQHTVLAILTFLLLQSLIYGLCLVKLAEIKKQPVPSPTKLKLLENEENLFDGGLYCGLFGTAASLIMLTLGVIKPSLISAYSSTLFGILFVALIKIIHVRPYKRRLILESDPA